MTRDDIREMSKAKAIKELKATNRVVNIRMSGRYSIEADVVQDDGSLYRDGLYDPRDLLAELLDL